MEHKIMKALSHAEMRKIMKYIQKKHCLVTGRCVKYLDMSYDYRTNEIWRVVIRPFGEGKEFSVTNRFDNPKEDSLYEEIMNWLKERE